MKEVFEVLDWAKEFVPSIVAVISLYYGWRANAEKNKLKAELSGLEAESQKSWLDLYKKLHDDQAMRLVTMEDKIQLLEYTIKIFEYAFKKTEDCRYVDHCPIGDELQKYKSSNRKGANQRPTTNRQREPGGQAHSQSDNSSTSTGED